MLSSLIMRIWESPRLVRMRIAATSPRSERSDLAGKLGDAARRNPIRWPWFGSRHEVESSDSNFTYIEEVVLSLP